MKNTITSNSAVLIKKIIVLIAAFGLFACSKNDSGTDPVNDSGAVEETRPSIIQFTESVYVLSTFVDVLETDSDLMDVLSSNGQKTLFAPTNDAFNEFLSGLDEFETLSDFDQPSELAILGEILKYHVVDAAAAYSNDLSNGKTLETAQSEEIFVEVDANVYLQDKTDTRSEILKADNEATNGVVHIIDKVLMPQAALELLFPKPSLLELVAETEDLARFEEAIEKAGMAYALESEEPMTVLAPSNEAIQFLFDLLGDDFTTFDDFGNPVEIQVLREIIWGHLVDGNLASQDFMAGKLETSLPGDYVELIKEGDGFEIQDASETRAKFLSLDHEASNGRLHIIDKILIPQKIKDFIKG